MSRFIRLRVATGAFANNKPVIGDPYLVNLDQVQYAHPWRGAPDTCTYVEFVGGTSEVTNGIVFAVRFSDLDGLLRDLPLPPLPALEGVESHTEEESGVAEHPPR